MEEFKQIIIVREDLRMSVGKLAAQVAHAALSTFLMCQENEPSWAERWLREGQRKIVCSVKDINELKKLASEAKEKGIPFYIVVDKGLTEVPPETETCLGLGPAPVKIVDEVTSRLRLLR